MKIRNNITMKPVVSLIPYIRNNKVHPDSQINLLARNIKEFGFNVPILIDKYDNIIAGHGRLLAAQKLEIQEIPCLLVDDLTEAQVKALRIADNRLTELAETNWEHLKLEFEELKELDYDVTLIGYEIDDISQNVTNEDSDRDVEPENASEIETEVKLGDIYQLGNHRLMCGDSTDKETVEKLMNGEKADMCFTDPPYNIGYQDMKKKYKDIHNDNMEENQFMEFLELSLEDIPLNSYICCNWKYYHLFYQVLAELNKPVKSCIVWDKETRVQNLDKYFKQHEFILYTGKLGGEKTIRGDVYKLSRERSGLHPTMKPIELCSTFIQDSSNQGNIVLDLFGGSGSTLIAAENTNRKCYMMELDPQYVQVIINRWEKLTGKNGQKIN